MGKVYEFESLEPFTFVDGVRLAWVKWRLEPGKDRRCVGVREVR